MLGDFVPGAWRTGASLCLFAVLGASSCRFDFELIPPAVQGTGGNPGGGAGASMNGGSWGGGSGGEMGGGSGGEAMMAQGGFGGAAMPEPSCTDGIRNQGEIAVDCGGPNCPCCNPGAFSTPEKVTGLGLIGEVYAPALSQDASTLYVASLDTDEDIFVATRTDRGVAFSSAVGLSTINSASLDGTPFESKSGLALYFYSERTGGLGSRDLMVATRDRRGEEFSSPSWLVNLNSPHVEQAPTLSSDELRIIFASLQEGTAGLSDLWIAERASIDGDFGAPQNMAELNTSFAEDGPSLAADELTLFFVSNRTGSQGFDVWMAIRNNRGDPFGEPTLIDALSSPGEDLDAFLSADGRELFFSSNRDGTYEVWRARRDCL